MQHAESYQTCGTPHNEPDDLNERIIFEIAETVAELLIGSESSMLKIMEANAPGLIDSAQLKASIPDALRYLAELMDKERAARLAKSAERSRAEWEANGRRPGR